MKLKLYQIDAFTTELFGGNPAAVIPLDHWIDSQLMQNIALENNVSETVFFVPVNNSATYDYEIKWFTPLVEIDLCGHATLASAFVLYEVMGFDKPVISFSSKSGVLKVSRENGMLCLDFPSWKPERFNDYPVDLQKGLGGAEIVGVYKKRDLLVELMNEDAIKKCQPDFSILKKSGYKLIITAPGKEVDFVSRFFAPTVGIDEDPVTGSAHSQLIPFWSEKLNKHSLTALQLSSRGGQLFCEQAGDRVKISGQCVFYMTGEITIPG
ncbi:MAG: PhzF family phenazine biosynthesis protein [Ginsengibacter sp.]